jgi:hypothetical protein
MQLPPRPKWLPLLQSYSQCTATPNAQSDLNNDLMKGVGGIGVTTSSQSSNSIRSEFVVVPGAVLDGLDIICR